MSRYPSRSRRTHVGKAPIIGFLLIASFGILFAGCTNDRTIDSVSFTQDDISRYRELAEEAARERALASSGAVALDPLPSGSESSVSEPIELDLSQADTYAALRAQPKAKNNVYQVTNPFVNIRSTPSTGSETIETLEAGAQLELVEFVDGQWAKVKISGDREGYVAHRYLSKVTTEERLAEERAEFENTYYVNFSFLNVRAEARQGSEKIGELSANAIVKPISIDGVWARIPFEDGEGYVSSQYLAAFSPNFVVRQDLFALPVLHYVLQADQANELLSAMQQQVNALRAEGYSFMTFADLRSLLLAQQDRDVRLDPKKVIIAMSGVTPDLVDAVSTTLNSANVRATIFLRTKDVGLSGITQRQLLTMNANGFDVQSAGHTGDDLRALTNSQAELELKQSRKILEDATGKTVFAIAYPQGAVNDRIMQMAAGAGYLFGLTDDAKTSFMRADFLRVPGMDISGKTDVDDVIEFVTGS